MESAHTADETITMRALHPLLLAGWVCFQSGPPLVHFTAISAFVQKDVSMQPKHNAIDVYNNSKLRPSMDS